jgi:hypothetical protein
MRDEAFFIRTFDTILVVRVFMNEATSELLAEANDIVREQLALAWREHIERVRDSLEAQWPERMERVLEETVAALAARLDEEHREALEARLQQAGRTAENSRREVIQKFSQIARRLRSFEDARTWSNTVVDSTRGFCGRAALFFVHDRMLSLETTRNFDDADLAGQVSLNDAPAFATAVETRDTLVAIASDRELSRQIADYLGEGDAAEGGGRVYLFPVVAGDQVPAVLLADSGDVDVPALELLVVTAGAIFENHRESPAVERKAALPADALVTISGQVAPNSVGTAPVPGGSASYATPTQPGTPAEKPEILSWFSLSREDKELHLRAQRFARVQVAGIRLYQSERVKNGRTAHDLYTSVKEEIDSARDAFRAEFLNASDSMVDYLHLELVRTLANDDAGMLGQDYPGQMV